MSVLRHLLESSRKIVLIAVFGCLAASIATLLLASRQLIRVIVDAWSDSTATAGKAAAVGFIQAVDLLLIATVFYIVSVGLYELYIDDSIVLPSWLHIRSLDDLKNKLLRMVVLVLAVEFLAQVAKWGGEPEIAALGAAIGFVTAALTWFLRSSTGK